VVLVTDDRAGAVVYRLLDEKRREFCFPVASQSAGAAPSASTLSEVRFPADQGIAGAVLAARQSW
jgi:hypothetical protein